MFHFTATQFLFWAYSNKKSELMLARRARAYNSFCSQVVLVHLHPFRRNSLFCNRKSQKILEPSILGFKMAQGHRRRYH